MLADVRGGYVSVQGAAVDYGVAVITVDEELVVDERETARLRRDERYDAKMFHNGSYVEAMV